MVNYTCDMCGQRIRKHTLRYIAKIEVFAAYDELEIRKEDLEKDYREAIERLIAKMKHMDPKKLMEDVWASFKFDLCKRCRDIYMQSPIGLIKTEELNTK